MDIEENEVNVWIVVCIEVRGRKVCFRVVEWNVKKVEKGRW